MIQVFSKANLLSFILGMIILIWPMSGMFVHNIPAPAMVLIPGGTYLMGQADGEGDERPCHTVQLDDFFLGKYEVTVAEYRQFCQSTGHPMPKEPDWGWQDNHPILNTSWQDAMAYIKWINSELKESYRLPTEAEFEYVIREGGKTGVYPWGKDMPAKENIADESFKTKTSRQNIWSAYDDGYAYTAPVGSFPANALGVHDINGNVWEWCNDWYAAYSDQPVINPQGPAAGTHKVGRGASYAADPWHTRSAGRSWVEPDFKGPGFRLAKY